jgi:hypothetical protein
VLTFAVDEASVTEVTDYLEQTRQNILAGIRVGMKEAMEGLSWTVADKLQGNPIVSRSGALLGRVLASPKVTETAAYIKGTVDAELGKKHLGIWLEGGTDVPAVQGKLFQFTTADGTSVYTHGHKAFRVAPHPFMNPSLNEYKPTILDIIAAKISEGANGTV